MPTKQDLTIKLASSVIQKTHITVSFADGKVFSLDNTSATWKKFRKALQEKRFDLVRKYVNAAEAIKTWSKGKLDITNGSQVTYAGKNVSHQLHAKILALVEANTPIEYLVRFLDNLYLNPSVESINDLYDFLEANNLPITDDGHFLAYKVVGEKYLDKYTNTIDNSVGKIVTMPREKVDDDRKRVSSYGLHFCQSAYVEHYKGERTVILKINPRDVVSIPTDYNRQKGRCCRYEVIGEVQPGTLVEKALLTAAMTTKAAKRKNSPKKAPKKRNKVR